MLADKIVAFSKLSLKKLNYCMLAAAFTISVIMLFAMHQTRMLYDSTHVNTQQLHAAAEVSTDLQEASDFLTEEIRLFVVTGDMNHLDHYFTEANVAQRREKALEFVKSRYDNTQAYVELNKALETSRTLMITEYHAAKLAANAYDQANLPTEVSTFHLSSAEENLPQHQKLALAKELLFNDEYKAQKRRISMHIMNCINDLEVVIWDQQQTMEKQLKDTILVEHILTFFLIIILIGNAFMTSKLVITPLQNCVKNINKDDEMPETGMEEIKFLANTYNKMRAMTLCNTNKLSYKATHDRLTKLYNRWGFDKIIEELDINKAAVAVIDVDKFKAINDTYGHDVGDNVLVTVACMLLKYFGDAGHVCRFGGDEFVVILENMTVDMQKWLTAQIDLINARCGVGIDDLPPFSISVGVSFCTSLDDIKTVLKQADELLYAAKQNHQQGDDADERV
jgi:diguanylate cyclase (GGDEF)-like protein